MIAISINKLTFRRALKNYKKQMPDLIKARIIKEINDAPAGSRIPKFLNIIKSNLDDILFGTPQRLMALSTRFNPFFTRTNAAGVVQETDLCKSIKRVLNYDWFTHKTVNRYSGYHMCEDLEINVCVYCNRSYTHTIITNNRRKISRPTLDHYFSKGKHPLLSISFYNLVPSCSICNSGVKHTADFQLISHYHPYLDDYIDEFKFSYKHDRQAPLGLKILVKSTDVKALTTLSELETQELYNTHSVELKEMLDMRYKFSDNYLTILEKSLLKGTTVSKEELYRIAFGTEPLQADFGRRPFSKFKYDILKQLKIIS